MFWNLKILSRLLHNYTQVEQLTYRQAQQLLFLSTLSALSSQSCDKYLEGEGYVVPPPTISY